MGLLQNMAGLGSMTEQVIATDFLLSAKTGVRNYAVAISETVSPNVREILRRQLRAAIDTHEKIMAYMIERGFYNVYDPTEQIRIDIKATETVLGLTQSSF